MIIQLNQININLVVTVTIVSWACAKLVLKPCAMTMPIGVVSIISSKGFINTIEIYKYLERFINPARDL